MTKIAKRFGAILLSMSMVFSTSAYTPADFAKNVVAAEISVDSLVTDFSYEFAYTTPGYADGTIRINAKEDGVYKVFWGDAEGNKLKKNGYEYTYLARVIVQNGKGSFNIISDYTVIPEEAKTVLVYRKDAKQYVYDIPADKLFMPEGGSYTFGVLSDLHYGRYSTVSSDDAVPAVDNALNFFNKIGIKFVGITGDLTSVGEQSSFDKYNKAIEQYPDMTVLTCTGNHDSQTTASSNTDISNAVISRWYHSVSSKYFTVSEDGTVTSNLSVEYPILANDAEANPIMIRYKDGDGYKDTGVTIPGLDFVTEAGGNICIFLNEIAKEGMAYNTGDLITRAQMDWLEKKLEEYKNRKVFLFFHSYLAVNTLENDVVDKGNSTGDLNNGKYSYNLDFADSVTTTSGKNMQALLSGYRNVTMFSGHSHWQYALQELNANLNLGKLNNGGGATLSHISSVTEPRYIGKDDSGRTELNGYASEGCTVTTYDDCIIYNNVDLYNKQYEAYSTYIVPAGDNSKYEPVKDSNYKEATDVVSGDEYLEPEDMTPGQLLKSNYNLMLGAGYVYSSKGSENTDGALTDGVSTGIYMNTKESKKGDQFVIVTLDGVQEVSNLKNFMLYFKSGNTDCSSYDIQLSLDGEKYETVGSYTGMTYATNTLDVDTSEVSINQYKYVKLILKDGAKAYGYQIREFAAIGYEKNKTPNTAGSKSSLIEGVIDEEDYLDSDYNLIYGADYTQSSVGSENGAGKLTDGKISGGYANTERKSSAKNQEFVIDLGKNNIQNVRNINFFLLYSKSVSTNATDFNVSVSLDGKEFQIVGTYSNVELDTNHFEPNFEGVSLEKFRYVKLNLTNGNTNYGYQISEFAVIGVKPMEYPEVSDQKANVADQAKNLALNKKVYVSSTQEKEGSGDPAVLTDGKTENAKHWSSVWDGKRTSEYIVVDLGEDYDTDQIGTVLVNFKSNNTFCKDYKIEFSKTFDEENPEEGFYEVARTKAASWEFLQKYSDPNGYVETSITDVEAETVRYVKINMSGHESWGFQIHEVAVIKKVKKPSDDQAKVSLSNTEYAYTGDEINPEIEVSYGGEVLIKDIDYTIMYENNIHPGTATVRVVGIGSYKNVIDDVCSFEILQKDINSSDIVVDDSNLKTNLEFNGQFRTPIVILKFNGIKLNVHGDYNVQYKNNFAPGTATITITGIGNYTGKIVKTFKIVAKPIRKVTIRTSFNAQKQLVVSANNGSYEMSKGKDYSWTSVTDGKGNITITIRGLGRNYSGTTVKKISAADNPNRPVVPKKVTLKKPKNVKKKKIQVTWGKISGVTGYEIRYSTSKKFKKATKKTIKKNVTKYTINKLKLKKTYYLQVRAYMVYNGTTYRGKWSNSKHIKVKK